MKHETCPVCNGTGMLGGTIIMFGEKIFIDYECSTCKGKGYIKKVREKND